MYVYAYEYREKERESERGREGEREQERGVVYEKLISILKNYIYIFMNNIIYIYI